VVIIAGVLLLAAVGTGIVLSRGEDDPLPADLTVGWGGSEGHPSCLYDPDSQTVDATIAIDGNAPRPVEVTVTVTAYADENTSRPVGSSSRSVPVEGTAHLAIVITIPVEKRPHIDEDGEGACRLSVEY
jgi:hypothetical protein